MEAVTEMNPYAPPSDDAPLEDKKRRKRKRARYTARFAKEALVVSRDAELPAVCMKCGAHDGIVRRNVKLQWTPAWARFLVFCVVGAILVLVTTKRTTLDVPLCARCNARWSAARNAAIGSAIAFIASFVVFRFGDERRELGLALFFAALTGFVALSIAYVRPRMLQVKRIDDAEITFKGVAPSAAQEIVEGSE